MTYPTINELRELTLQELAKSNLDWDHPNLSNPMEFGSRMVPEQLPSLESLYVKLSTTPKVPHHMVHDTGALLIDMYKLEEAVKRYEAVHNLTR